MSGFGIRAFKKLKEESVKKEETIYKKHIVFGDNFYAAFKALKLIKEHGAENVLVISTNLITTEKIKNEWKCSINTIRNDEDASLLMGHFPHLEILKCDHEVEFYKDTKFHKFGGRAKPYPLLEDEEFFSNPFYNLKMENLFSQEQWTSLDETLEQNTKIKIIRSIEKIQSQDLVEKRFFRLRSGEFENIECENLYFCHSPKDFFSLVSNKKDLSLELTGFCSSMEQRVALSVHFDCDAKVTDNQWGVLLPQSATHDWGHFVLDFDTFDSDTKRQKFNAMMFINLDEVNEEELAKKIKHMKRVIERVYPDFANSKYEEHIHYNPEFLMKNFPESSEINCEGLQFLGPGANLKSINSSSILLTRALLSLIA